MMNDKTAIVCYINFFIGGVIMTRKITFVAMFAALTAVGAFIRIPFYPVPFTLQFLFCCLSGLLLGARLGALSQFVYVALGLVGLPIYAKGYGGLNYVFEPTFGYLLGFIICSYVTGLLFEKMKQANFVKTLTVTLVGMLLLYVPGVTYMYYILNFYIPGKSIALTVALTQGFFVFIPSGIILCILSSMIALKVKPTLTRIFNN